MRKAFTLLEILVVIGIIALLASITVVSYSRFVKQSRDARRKTDLEQIRAAIELYRNFKSVYPTPGMVFGTDSIVDGSTTYMSKIPQDPMFSGAEVNTYYYTSPGPTYQDYTLCTYLEGGGTASGYLCGTTLVCNYCMGPYGQK